MKKGDKVEIYENFITKDKSEGKAKLIKLERTESECGHSYEFWKVAFLDEPESQYSRAILQEKP